MTVALKEKHDQLLAEKPDDASHDEASCLFCNPEQDPIQGGDMSKTYTEDELVAAVNEAVAPVKAELEKAREALSANEIDEKIAAIRTEFEQRIAELENEKDVAEARANEAEAELNNTLSYLASEVEAAEQAQLVEARKESRKAAVSEVASFTDEQIEAKIDRWTAMDDDVFEVYLEDLKSVARKGGSENTGEQLPTQLPAETAMNHTRTSGNAPAFEGFFDLVSQGFDPKTL